MTTTLHPHLAPAIAPIESTGRERHDVSLLVAGPDQTIDTRFHRIGEHLRRGDVLVVNTSATEPAAISGRLDGRLVDVHVSGPAASSGWVIELRLLDRSGPLLNAHRCDRIEIDGGTLTLTEAAETAESGVRLWNAAWSGRISLIQLVRSGGRPIRYEYVPESWSLDSYRTIFEVRRPEFSSAEMPSAARPFTRRLVRDLHHRGIELAHVTLHTGVSSLEGDEGPMPERFRVDAVAAARINRARAHGNRVVAVGTTSARAVESASSGAEVCPAEGWTDLVLSDRRPTSVVNGIVTGWHPPEASHLDLLEAIVGGRAVTDAYHAARELGYRSHEFGDSCLLLQPG